MAVIFGQSVWLFWPSMMRAFISAAEAGRSTAKRHTAAMKRDRIRVMRKGTRIKVMESLSPSDYRMTSGRIASDGQPLCDINSEDDVISPCVQRNVSETTNGLSTSLSAASDGWRLMFDTEAFSNAGQRRQGCRRSEVLCSSSRPQTRAPLVAHDCCPNITEVARPGIEPGSQRSKRRMLSVTPAGRVGVSGRVSAFNDFFAERHAAERLRIVCHVKA